MASHSEAASSNISLASQMLDPSSFGTSERTIADLDAAYAAAPRQTQ